MDILIRISDRLSYWGHDAFGDLSKASPPSLYKAISDAEDDINLLITKIEFNL